MGQSRPAVAIARIEEQRVFAAVSEAVDLIGGISQIVPRGARVFVKPNFTQAPADCSVTNVQVLDAVVRLVAEAGAGRIEIGEAPGDVYAPLAFRVYGAGYVAERYGATLVDLNAEPGARRPVPPGLGREYVLVPQAVAEADVVVSVPTLKLWFVNPMSLALKNWIGLYGGSAYGYNHNSRQFLADHPERVLDGEIGAELGCHEPTVAAAIAAMNFAVKPDLVVIDGVEGGSGTGRNLRMDLVIAGRDPMATDVVGMAVAGIDAASHPNFRFFAEVGLGSARLADVEVRGVPVGEVAFDLRRLHGNVRELPAERCLRSISTGEMRHLVRVLGMYDFIDAAAAPTLRGDLVAFLGRTISRPEYQRAAIGRLTPRQRDFLRLLVEMGGTATSYYAIKDEFSRRQSDGYLFWPCQRAVMRLGLAYVFDSQSYPYYLLAEGVAEALAALDS